MCVCLVHVSYPLDMEHISTTSPRTVFPTYATPNRLSKLGRLRQLLLCVSPTLRSGLIDSLKADRISLEITMNSEACLDMKMSGCGRRQINKPSQEKKPDELEERLAAIEARLTCLEAKLDEANAAITAVDPEARKKSIEAGLTMLFPPC